MRACCLLAHCLLLRVLPRHLQGLRTFEQVDEVEAMQEGRRKKGQWGTGGGCSPCECLPPQLQKWSP